MFRPEFAKRPIMKALIASLALLGLAACASAGGDPEAEWTSAPGATAFDAAYRECEEQTLTTHGVVFNACMSDKGWTRTPS
jgi:hypothetical protein